MVGSLFVRATVIGLMVVLAGVGCGGAEPGGLADGRSGTAVEVTGGPNPGDPNPGNPDPGGPNPGNPDPGNPDPGNPDPGGPNPDNANPDNPDLGNPAPPPEELEIAWVPPGPGDIARFDEFPAPPGDEGRPARWSEAFEARDCEAIAALGPERDEQQLYQGLGAACRAVLREEDWLWPTAETALRQVGHPANCLDQAALRLLRDLVTAHQRDPNAEIRIVDPQSGSKCGTDSPSTTTSGRSPVPGEPTQPTAPSGPFPPSG